MTRQRRSALTAWSLVLAVAAIFAVSIYRLSAAFTAAPPMTP